MKSKLLCITFALLAMILNANDQTDGYWSGGSSASDNFSEAYNWFGVNAPSSGDNLYFNNSTGIRHMFIQTILQGLTKTKYWIPTKNKQNKSQFGS